jgi:hypothetical protein
MNIIHMSLTYIQDNDKIDEDIINTLIDIPLDNDYINYILDNISYEEDLLTEKEFNNILYDICNNNIENINEIYDFQKVIQYYGLQYNFVQQ